MRPFVCPDGRRHEIKYHYYTGAEGRRIWHGECEYSDGVLDGAFFLNFTDGYGEYMASGEFDRGRLAGEMHISSDDETFISEFDGDGKPSGVW